VSASAPWQPSEAFSRIHFPAAQICMTLSAIQNPAPSLKDRPAHAQPLAGTGRRYVGGSWSASGGGDGAGWARAAESKRALIKIVLASIRIIAPFVDAPPSHAGHRIIIRDYDTSIVGNRELFHFSRCRFRMSARRQGCPTGERPPATEHQDTAELRQGNRQQVSRAAVGGLTRPALTRWAASPTN
jgi:hypothetical protein